MTRKKACKICHFYDHAKWFRGPFEAEVIKGRSLRELSSFLRGQGLECSPKTISKHVRTCMHMEIKEQGTIEKAIKKTREWFTKPELPQPEECKHLRIVPFFDISTEQVFSKCLDCGKLLGSEGPEEKRNKRKDQAIWRSLRK